MGVLPVNSGRDPGERKAVWGWILYDWANSAFVTTITSTIFAIYFKRTVVGEDGVVILGNTIPGGALWGYLATLAMAIVAVSSPVLGAMADAGGARKRFLFFYWVTGCLATSLLYFSHPGGWLLAGALYVIANVAFAGGEVFYNALLMNVARPERFARVSLLGYALGYVGGGLCLVLNVGIIRLGADWPDHLGVRANFPVVSAWWFLFAIPAFLWIREGRADVARGVGHVREGFRRVWATFLRIRRYRELGKFFLAYFLYNDGVTTVIAISAVWANDVLGIEEKEMGMMFIMIQFVAFLGSLFFLRFAARMGERRVIGVCIAVWVAALVWAYFISRPYEMWIVGALVGSVLGGIQAASRSLLARLIPQREGAEFFGFFAVAGKFAAILGPFTYAVILDTTDNPRLAIISLVLFFLIGGGILCFVNEDRARREAGAAP